MSAFDLKADISPCPGDVGFVPTADLPTTGVAQLIQQLFGRDQIGSPETLRKAVVDWLKAGDGVGGAALTAQQAGEARRRPQFPGQGALLLRDGEGLPEQRGGIVPMAECRHALRLDPQQLRLAPAFLPERCAVQRFLYGILGLLEFT